MKKQKSPMRHSGARNKGAPKDIDEYLAGIPKPARTMLSKMRAIIRSAVPKDATETVSYRIPAFRRQKVLVWFAAFSDHCSLFPTASVIERFKDELKRYATSKGTIHFPLDKPLPTTLIKKLVKTRVVEAEGKKQR